MLLLVYSLSGLFNSSWTLGTVILRCSHLRAAISLCLDFVPWIRHSTLMCFTSIRCERLPCATKWFFFKWLMYDKMRWGVQERDIRLYTFYFTSPRLSFIIGNFTSCYPDFHFVTVVFKFKGIQFHTNTHSSHLRYLKFAQYSRKYFCVWFFSHLVVNCCHLAFTFITTTRPVNLIIIT